MCRVLLHFREQDFVGNRQATLLHVVAWCHMFSVEKGSWRLFFKKAILWHLGKKTRKHKGLGPHLTLDDSHWHRRCRRVQGLCPNGIRGGQGGSSISAWPSLGPKGKVNFGPVFFGPITNSIPICRVWAFPICFSLCRSYLMLFYGTSLSRWTAVFFFPGHCNAVGQKWGLDHWATGVSDTTYTFRVAWWHLTGVQKRAAFQKTGCFLMLKVWKLFCSRITLNFRSWEGFQFSLMFFKLLSLLTVEPCGQSFIMFYIV